MAAPHTITSGSARPFQLNAETLGGIQLNDQGGFHALAGGVSGSNAAGGAFSLNSDIHNNSLISALNFIYDSASGNEPGAPESAIQFNDGSGGFGGNVKFVFNATDGVFLDAPLAVTGNVAAAGRIIQANTTDAATTSDGALSTAGGLSVAKDVVAGDDVSLLSDAAVLNFGADKDVSLTHVADTGLLMNAASVIQFRDSALSIGSAADGRLDITADTAIDLNGAVLASSTITATGRVIVDDATEATSTTDGSLQTDGGLSVVKDVVAGDDVSLLSDAAVLNFGADRDVSLTHVADTGLLLNGASVIQFRDSALSIGSAGDGRLDITADTAIDLNGAVLASSTVTATGRVIVDDVTEATSTTDGSIQTDGGLSVAKSAVIGDDLDLLSDAAILSFGADKDVSLTHVADTGLLMNAASVIQFRDSAISVGSAADGKLDLTADGGIDLNSAVVAAATDSATDLGSDSVRFANLFVDSIGDGGQNLNVASPVLAGVGATFSTTLGVTGISTLAGGITGSAGLELTTGAARVPVMRVKGAGASGKAALFLSSSVGDGNINIGDVLSVAQRNALPTLGMQGTDHEGKLRQYSIAVSGGMLVANLFADILG